MTRRASKWRKDSGNIPESMKENRECVDDPSGSEAISKGLKCIKLLKSLKTG